MMILTIANAKGGVGKTTLTIAIALERALGWGWRVLCYDADTQRTLYTWADVIAQGGLGTVFRDNAPPEAPHNVVIVREFTGAEAVRADAAALGADLVVIDCKLVRSGDQAQLLRQQAALRMADIALVPMRASQVDFISQREGDELLAAAPGPVLRYVISASPAASLPDARLTLEASGYAVLKAAVREQRDFRSCIQHGCTERPRRLTRSAGRELRALLRELRIDTTVAPKRRMRDGAVLSGPVSAPAVSP